jgi:hypothetical protein
MEKWDNRQTQTHPIKSNQGSPTEGCYG